MSSRLPGPFRLRGHGNETCKAPCGIGYLLPHLPLRLRQRGQGDLAQLPQVAGQLLRSIGGVERGEVVPFGREPGQDLVEGLATWLVVEARREVLRGYALGTGRGLGQWLQDGNLCTAWEHS